MKKAILIILSLVMGSSLVAYELGIKASNYSKNAFGAYVEESLTEKLSYNLSYTREFDRKFSRTKLSKKSDRSLNACGCPEPKEVVGCPQKPETNEPATTPNDNDKGEVIIVSTEIYEKSVDRLEFDLNYRFYSLTLPSIKAPIMFDGIVGVGYTFRDEVYKENLFLPIGLRVGFPLTKRFNIYSEYKALFELDNIRPYDSGSIMVGYKF